MPENAAMSNGVHHEVPEFLGPKRMINRQEYIRLMEQSLHRLGFTAAAQQLERDSVQPPTQSPILAELSDLPDLQSLEFCGV